MMLETTKHRPWLYYIKKTEQLWNNIRWNYDCTDKYNCSESAFSFIYDHNYDIVRSQGLFVRCWICFSPENRSAQVLPEMIPFSRAVKP